LERNFGAGFAADFADGIVDRNAGRADAVNGGDQVLGFEAGLGCRCTGDRRDDLQVAFAILAEFRTDTAELFNSLLNCWASWGVKYSV
jgi:hypothetical protein